MIIIRATALRTARRAPTEVSNAMRDVSRRSRPAYAGAALLVPWIGVGARWVPLAIPEVVAANAGDALGALTVFLVVGLLFPSAPTWQVALGAFGSSTLLGLSHWYSTPWLDAARGSALGGLFLNRFTSPLDLGCCAAGVGLGIVAEWLVMDG
jgi:hypothetical protein